MCSLSSGDASDSICPKGWGMAELEGDGSYEKLIKNVNSLHKNKSHNLSHSEYNSLVFPQEIIRQTPLSFIKSGQYSLDHIYRSNDSGYYSERSVNSKNYSYVLNFFQRYIDFNRAIENQFGDSLRCVAK